MTGPQWRVTLALTTSIVLVATGCTFNYNNPLDTRCESTCDRRGATRCIDGALATCVEAGDGCLAWGAAASCPSGACASQTACAACVAECTTLGATACDQGQVRTCEESAEGCLKLGAPVACPIGSCASASACAGCSSICTAGTTRCDAGNLETCTQGSNGCASWSTPVACPGGGACANAEHCATCLHACEIGDSRCTGGVLSTCQTNERGCRVFIAAVACPEGACADESSCANCVADCSGRECGPDHTCGKSCGSCTEAGETCNTDGICGPWCALGEATCAADGNEFTVCGYDASAVKGQGTPGPSIPCHNAGTCHSGACGRSGCWQSEVMLLVDRSASMQTSGIWPWLVSTLADVLALHEKQSNLGVSLFPSDAGCGVGAFLAPALNNASAVVAALAPPSLQSSTPLTAALTSVVPAFGDPDDAQAAIVITDGEEACATQSEALAAAAWLWRSGVRVYVIALSTTANRTFLDKVAAQGGTGQARVANDAKGLATALTEIFAETSACECTPQDKKCVNGLFYDCSANGRWAVPQVCEARLEFMPAPAPNVLTGNVWPSFAVKVVDSAGALITQGSFVVSLKAGGWGPLVGTTTRATVNGVATFDDISDGTYIGLRTLHAEANGAVASSTAMVLEGFPGHISAWTHTCAVLTSGALKCWGDNSAGQLGLEDAENRLSPAQAVDLGSGRTALAVAAGSLHTCALLDDHSVKCWGKDRYIYGYGDYDSDHGDTPGDMDMLQPMNLGGLSALQISAGGSSSCALLEDHTVQCWGENTEGELGGVSTTQPPAANRTAVNLGTGRTARAVAVGYAHACAVLDDNSVKCWGRNAQGQLGLGDKVVRGSTNESMGDNLPAVDLGTGRTALAVAAGGDASCALLDDYTIKCWGCFRPICADDVLIGDQPNEMGDDLAPVNLGAGLKALAIATVGSFNCAVVIDELMASPAVKCWGENSSGQLGLGDRRERFNYGGDMGNKLPNLDLPYPVNIALGGEYACVMTPAHALKCWGNNLHGHLGLGDTSNRGDEPGEMGDALPFVVLGK